MLWRSKKKFEDEKWEALLHEDSCQAQTEFAESLRVDHTAVSKYLKALGMIQKQGHLERHQTVSCHKWTASSAVEKEFFFLHRTVTDNKKWTISYNPKCRRSWSKPGHASTSAAKSNIQGSKFLLCI